MARQATVKINNSFKQKTDEIYKYADTGARNLLKNMAYDATQWSPVDTGAYVTSFSFKKSSSSRGRSKTSSGKPRGQNVQAKKDEGFDNLMQDLQGFDLRRDKSVTLRNDAPHARNVEDGWPTKSGYGVFRKLRNKYG